ncbi:MAG: riboflavin kinase [Candidatus Gracilibacteria bacterium]|jgi:riboflavin kinase/FMN adenylyltransferase
MEIIEGQVVKGLGVGKKLGFETINILYDGKLSGVFAGKVFVGEKPKEGFLSAVHIGKRPTVNENVPILEAHIIDGFEKFSKKDFVGEKIKVEIFEKIRDTKKFENLDELKKQIAKDVVDVGYFFKRNT